MGFPPNEHNIAALEQFAALNKSEKGRLGEFLATGALYSHFSFAEGSDISRLPDTIQLYCAGTCSKAQTFERIVTASGPSDKGWGRVATYRCRNCQQKQQSYMYVWKEDGFWKVGQVPELREAIDPILRKALGESFSFYQKAVRSRSFGFGIGAVSYLRRIIEDRTDQLMDLLKDEKWDSWSEAQRQEFEDARATFQYSQKIEYAAEKILPVAAFANGRDSFTALHDVTSSGLHGKTEEECIDIFDRCNVIFTRTFQILHEHKRERDDFAAQLAALKR